MHHAIRVNDDANVHSKAGGKANLVNRTTQTKNKEVIKTKTKQQALGQRRPPPTI